MTARTDRTVPIASAVAVHVEWRLWQASDPLADLSEPEALAAPLTRHIV